MYVATSISSLNYNVDNDEVLSVATKVSLFQNVPERAIVLWGSQYFARDTHVCFCWTKSYPHLTAVRSEIIPLLSVQGKENVKETKEYPSLGEHPTVKVVGRRPCGRLGYTDKVCPLEMRRLKDFEGLMLLPASALDMC